MQFLNFFSMKKRSTWYWSWWDMFQSQLLTNGPFQKCCKVFGLWGIRWADHMINKKSCQVIFDFYSGKEYWHLKTCTDMLQVHFFINWRMKASVIEAVLFIFLTSLPQNDTTAVCWCLDGSITSELCRSPVLLERGFSRMDGSYWIFACNDSGSFRE